MFYSFITNNKENLILDNNPLILKNYLNEIKGKVQLFDGLEFATTSCHKTDVHFDDNKISENKYWIDKDDKRNVRMIEILCENYIWGKYSMIDIFNLESFNEIINEILHKKISYIIYLDELCEREKNKIICFYVKYEKEEMNENTIYYIDLNFINYFTNDHINSFDSLLELSAHEQIKQWCLNYDDIKLLLRAEGLVTKTYEINHIVKFVKENSSEKTKNNLHQIILFLLMNFVEENLDETIINEGDRNLIKTEDYLSNVYINSIDVMKYTEIMFPQKRYGINYSYNGSYNVTGRIYANNLNKEQSLQNLTLEKRDVLNSDEGCILIEYDYKSAEFDIVLQLCKIKYDDKADLHYETMKTLIPNSILKVLEYEKIAFIGKKTNYSIIYGMNINNVFIELINDLQIEDENIKSEILINLVNWEVLEKIQNVKGKINENVDFVNKLLKNYFGRYIKYNKEHAVFNNYIQSTVVDLICRKICKIVDLIKNEKISRSKNKILLQNHDSILLQLEERLVDETNIINNIHSIMCEEENELKGRVRMKYGKNWRYLQ